MVVPSNKMSRKGKLYFEPEMPAVDILLPAYNPLPGWEETVIDRFRSLQQALPEFSFQLVLVNDGSTVSNWSSGLSKVVENVPGTIVISYEQNQGKGHALREGVKLSTGDYILYTDIDWPYTEDSMISLIHRLQFGADVAVGVRNKSYDEQLPPMRKKISNWLKRINSKLLHLKVDDTQAGLKGFNKKVKEIFLSTRIKRYLFDLEFIYLLSKKKISVISVPVELRSGIKFSKMNRKVLLTEGWNFIRIWMKGVRDKG